MYWQSAASSTSASSHTRPAAAAAVDGLGYGRVALVTAVRSPVGLAVTRALLAHQFSVCGVEVAPPDSRQGRVGGKGSGEEAFDYAALIRDEDQARFHFHRVDGRAQSRGGPNEETGATEEEMAVEEAVRACVAAYGPHISVLVNVTGCSTGLFPAPHPDASFPTSPTAAAADDDDWARTLAADLTVPAALMRRAMPFMVARSGKGEGYDDSTGAQGGGVIVNIIATTTPGPPLSVAAAAAGAGLIGASKYIAIQCRSEGVRCNVVQMGASTDHTTLGAQTELAQEAAETIIFLVSDAARAISGAVIPVGGGGE